MVSEHLRVREFILSALLKATVLHSKDAQQLHKQKKRSVETDLLNSPSAASHHSNRPGSQCPFHSELLFCQTGITPDYRNNIGVWGIFLRMKTSSIILCPSTLGLETGSISGVYMHRLAHKKSTAVHRLYTSWGRSHNTEVQLTPSCPQISPGAVWAPSSKPRPGYFYSDFY